MWESPRIYKVPKFQDNIRGYNFTLSTLLQKTETPDGLNDYYISTKPDRGTVSQYGIKEIHKVGGLTIF